MSTPEIDPVTAERMEQDAANGSERAEPPFRDREPHPEATAEEDPAHGGLPTACAGTDRSE